MSFPLPTSTELTKAVQPYVQVSGTKFHPYRAIKLEGKGKGKGKGKMVRFTLEQATKAQRGSRGIALSFISALDAVGCQRHTPASLSPGKTRYPSYRRLGGPQSRSGQVQKILPPPEFDPQTVRPVASHYTDPQKWKVGREVCSRH
jgi:hypothetical protein